MINDNIALIIEMLKTIKYLGLIGKREAATKSKWRSRFSIPEVSAGSLCGDIEGNVHLKLIIRVLV